MTRVRVNSRQSGFSLVELLMALGVFLVVCGAAFSLLYSSQQRYKSESQMLNSFQEARLGLDQIIRDVNDAGFPPPSFLAAPGGNPLIYVASSPFAWSQGAGYPNNPCQIGTAGGGNCFTASGDSAPGDFDLIIETTPNPQDPTCAPCPAQWIRYQLPVGGTTLMRGAVYKVSNGDPDGLTAAAGLAPFVQNVMNNASAAQILQFQKAYPNMFPGGAVPIFQYTCDHPATPQSPPPPTTQCIVAAGDNSPTNIRDVIVTLIVAAPTPDGDTGLQRLVQLTGRARRINPNQ
jgi:prepilin-type N-terminal cleavage/methylation domain-containing protein